MFRRVLSGLLLAVAGALPAWADPLDVAIDSGFTPANVISLFTNGPGQFITPYGMTPTGAAATAGWITNMPPGGTMAQIFAPSGAPTPILNASFLIDFTAPTSFDYQFIVMDTNGQILSFAVGSLFVDSAGVVSINPGGYGSAGGPRDAVGNPIFMAPAPEPSSVLVGALGLGVLGLRRLRRRAAAA